MKTILSLDGGGIRGAATAQFLKRVEEGLNWNGRSLRDCVDLLAGTSTGGIIALAIAMTDLSISEICDLYSYETAKRIFTRNRGLFEVDGVNAPKYEGGGKLEVLIEKLGTEPIGKAKIPVMVTAYDVMFRTPLIIKSFKNTRFETSQAADATSAAPTYFPTVQRMGILWLIDGGVVANNPAMCALAEAFHLWPDWTHHDFRVISVGTGNRTKPVDGPASCDWGALGWMTMGHLLDIVMDEGIVDYQARAILGRNYLRVNSELKQFPGMTMLPEEEMDCVTRENIEALKQLGDYWFEKFGEEVLGWLEQ